MNDALYLLRWRDCGLSKAQAAAWFGVSLKTWNRWESGQIEPPLAVLHALRLRSGDLEPISADFSGYRIDIANGLLTFPNGDYCAPGDLYGITFLKQQLTTLRRQVDTLRAELDQAKKNPALAGSVRSHNKKSL